MATPSNGPMSMTRGTSFLPGNLRPKQDVEEMIQSVRWTKIEADEDHWRRGKRRRGKK